MVAARTESKSAWKRFRRQYLRPVRNAFIGCIGAPLVRLWIGSLRMRWHGDVYRVNGLPNGLRRGIYVFWHQGLLTIAGSFRDSGSRIVISSHGDGELIARIAEKLGNAPVRGSSTRGGSRVMLELLRGGEDDGNIAITPDGPRGPKHHVHSGTIYLASRSGLPIYPVAVKNSRALELGTWDNFLLPLPFSRGLVALGDPMNVPPDADRETIESHRAALQEQLQRLTRTSNENFSALYAAARRTRDLPLRPTAGGSEDTDGS